MVINQKLCDVFGQNVDMGGEHHRYYKHQVSSKSKRWPRIPCWFDTEWPFCIIAVEQSSLMLLNYLSLYIPSDSNVYRNLNARRWWVTVFNLIWLDVSISGIRPRAWKSIARGLIPLALCRYSVNLLCTVWINFIKLKAHKLYSE